MMTPTRTRTPILAIAAIALGLAAVGGILLVGRVGTPEATPASLSTASPSPTSARRTHSPPLRARSARSSLRLRTLDEPMTQPRPPLCHGRAVVGVPVGRRGSSTARRQPTKPPSLTVQQLDNVRVEATGDTATVRLTYTEAGYDIGLDSGQPLESPGSLAPRDVTVELRQVDGHWLVDGYEAQVQ